MDQFNDIAETKIQEAGIERLAGTRILLLASAVLLPSFLPFQGLHRQADKVTTTFRFAIHSPFRVADNFEGLHWLP